MFISEKNPHKVLFIGKNRSNFHTLDMGVSYQPCPQIDIMDVRLHPRQPDWILASSMSEGCHPTEDGGVSEHECYKIVRTHGRADRKQLERQGERTRARRL